MGINGNDKISENVTITNNTIVRTFYGLQTAGAISYSLSFIM